MKRGDLYHHFKGNDYHFNGIATPLSEFTGEQTELKEVTIAYDAHTPDGEEIREVQLYTYKGLWMVDRDVPHCMYERVSELNKIWIRQPDDFFGYKEKEGQLIRRFTKQ